MIVRLIEHRKPSSAAKSILSCFQTQRWQLLRRARDSSSCSRFFEEEDLERWTAAKNNAKSQGSSQAKSFCEVGLGAGRIFGSSRRMVRTTVPVPSTSSLPTNLALSLLWLELGMVVCVSRSGLIEIALLCPCSLHPALFFSLPCSLHHLFLYGCCHTQGG